MSRRSNFKVLKLGITDFWKYIDLSKYNKNLIGFNLKLFNFITYYFKKWHLGIIYLNILIQKDIIDINIIIQDKLWSQLYKKKKIKRLLFTKRKRKKLIKRILYFRKKVLLCFKKFDKAIYFKKKDDKLKIDEISENILKIKKINKKLFLKIKEINKKLIKIKQNKLKIKNKKFLIFLKKSCIFLYRLNIKKIKKYKNFFKHYKRLRRKNIIKYLSKFNKSFFYFNILQLQFSSQNEKKNKKFEIPMLLFYKFINYFFKKKIYKFIKYQYKINLNLLPISFVLNKFPSLFIDAKIIYNDPVHHTYKKFYNENFLDYILMIRLSFLFNNPQYLTDLISFLLSINRNHNKTCNMIFSVITDLIKFNNYRNVLMVRLEMSGRFNGNIKKKKKVFKTDGNLNTQSLTMPAINYAFSKVNTFCGAFGIKCWFLRKEDRFFD